MRPQSLLLPVLGVLVVAIVAFAAVFALGGDSDAPGADPDATASASPAADDGFGPAPDLGRNVTSVLPQHASTITQAESVPAAPNAVGGICGYVNFEGIPVENLILWFQMAVDGELVTNQLTIFANGEPPTDAVICYPPPAPLEPGMHSAAISVTDPNNPGSEPRQIAAWKFEVVADQ